MGFFNKKQHEKKQHQVNVVIKCPAEGCSFTCNTEILLKKHTDWKHPDLKKVASK